MREKETGGGGSGRKISAVSRNTGNKTKGAEDGKSDTADTGTDAIPALPERPNAARENLRKVGNEGEAIACRYLERSGFEILFRNWTARSAEIDVVARDCEGTIWFFEVKFRRSRSAGCAAEAFTPKKRRDFFRAVSLCCAKYRWHADSVRTGLVAVDGADGGYRITRYSDLSPDATN